MKNIEFKYDIFTLFNIIQLFDNEADLKTYICLQINK